MESTWQISTTVRIAPLDIFSSSPADWFGFCILIFLILRCLGCPWYSLDSRINTAWINVAWIYVAKIIVGRIFVACIIQDKISLAYI